MPSQFDAVARISVDLRGFREASQQVTKSGGEMERVFRNLHGVLSKIEPVEKSLANELSRTMRVYQQISSAARAYASAVQSLSQNSAGAANGAKVMATAFEKLRSSLAAVQGMSEREASRIQRTLSLYQQMASVLNTLATAQQRMMAATQGAATAQQRAQTASKAATAAQQRAANDQLRIQRDIEQARARSAASAQRDAQAQHAASLGMTAFATSASGVRSALQDLEGLYSNVARGLGQVATAATAAAISHEAAFAQIARVTELTGEPLAQMRAEFEKLANVLPVSFEEVTRIGQLASQTGVANEQLVTFTDTVVRFSVTTGIASEQVTLLFGRIRTMRDIPLSQMENFASTVLALGVASASTEDEILKVTESIATVTDLFGLSTQATLGLSSALATLRVRPELARGALTRVLGELSNVAAEGGSKLTLLANILGETEDATRNLVQTNPDEFFLKFIKGMGGTTTRAGELRRTLASLGVDAVRDVDVISRLANNYDTLAEHVGRARVEFLLGNKLQKQSQTIFDTTRVRIDNLKDAFNTLLANAGKPLAAALGLAATALTKIVEILNRVPLGIQVFGGLTIAAAAFGVALTARQILIAKMLRATVALTQAQRILGQSTFTLRTAFSALNQAQAGSVATTTAQARATAAAAAAQTAAAQQMARATAAARTANTASAGTSTAAALSPAAAATAYQALAARQAEVAATAARVNSALSASSLAAANTATAVRNAGVSMTGLANVQRTYGAAVAVTAGSQAKMEQVYRQTTASATAATAANTAAAASTTAVGTAATFTGRALLLLRTHWVAALGIIGLVGVALSGVVSAFQGTQDQISKTADEAFSAVGGMDAYNKALAADTAAAEQARGGLAGIQQGLKESGRVATETGTFYSTLTSHTRDLAGAAGEEARQRLRLVQQQKQSILLAQGTEASLRSQAQGQGAAAKAARQHLDDLGALTQEEKKLQAALGGTTLAIGDETKQLIQNQFQQTILKSGMLDTRKDYERLSKAIKKSGFKAEDIAGQDAGKSLGKIRTELKSLQKEYDRLDRQYLSSRGKDGDPGTAKRLRKERDAVAANMDAYRTLETFVGKTSSAFDKAKRSTDILTALGLDPLGDSAKNAADGLQTTEEGADAAVKAIDSLAEAYKGLINPADAWQKVNEKGKASIQSFTAELQKQANAQAEYAKNLAILSSQGYGSLVDQLKEMGPQGAQAAKELVNGSKKELDKLEGIAVQAGAGFQKALATALSSVETLDVGKKTAASLSKAISTSLQSIASTGGDFSAASGQIVQIVDLINKKTITPKIGIDVVGALGDLEKLKAAIDAASKSGTLDAEGKATLNTLLFDTALAQLKSQVKGIEERHEVDAKGKAQLDPKGYQEEMNKLRSSTAAKVLQGYLDAKGKAQLDDETFRTKIGQLAALVLTKEQQKQFDLKGIARMDDAEFKRLLNLLKATVTGTNSSGALNPKGKAQLDSKQFKNDLWGLRGLSQDTRKGIEDQLKNIQPSVATGTFQQQLGGLVQAASRTGSSIQAALSRTATVNVVYRNANRPPPRTAQAATGGWIRGPGTGTSDSIPARLSNGEFVVRSRQAKRHASLLEAINRGRPLPKPVAAPHPGLSYARAEHGSRAGGQAGRSPRKLVGAMGRDTLKRVEGRADVRSGPIINVNNTYPRSEPTSTTINRSLAYAAALNGTM
ncbi:phage tail tape measure protein [Streptomyces sp. 5-10]|uniref:phage tail tape measure protein n=1 Tax=Streptomyces sp. 5-10 TaxID=878925 RepID=UPI00168A7911|nr:phage tail tape measure protein [Streptomyces sp. 5-10]MBD3004908.1 phage tail tape measure protein [Streptomyces sp. 5-10]